MRSRVAWSAKKPKVEIWFEISRAALAQSFVLLRAKDFLRHFIKIHLWSNFFRQIVKFDDENLFRRFRFRFFPRIARNSIYGPGKKRQSSTRET